MSFRMCLENGVEIDLSHVMYGAREGRENEHTGGYEVCM